MLTCLPDHGEASWGCSILVYFGASHRLHSVYFLSVNQCLADKLKTFLALDHFDYQILFKFLMVLLNVLIKLFETTSNLSSNILTFLLKIDGFVTYKEKVLLDPDNWNGDVHFLDHSFDL